MSLSFYTIFNFNLFHWFYTISFLAIISLTFFQSHTQTYILFLSLLLNFIIYLFFTLFSNLIFLFTKFHSFFTYEIQTERAVLKNLEILCKLLFCALFIVNIYILLINFNIFFLIHFFIHGRKRRSCAIDHLAHLKRLLFT